MEVVKLEEGAMSKKLRVEESPQVQNQLNNR